MLATTEALCCFVLILLLGTPAAARCSGLGEETVDPGKELAELRAAVREQARELEELRQAIVEQGKILAGVNARFPRSSVEPSSESVPSPAGAAGVAEARVAATQSVVQVPGRANTAAIGAQAEDADRTIGGFRMSGDFIYAFDMQARSSNAIAPALQNLRSRYRVRLNIDRLLNRQTGFHLQLSTGSLNNQLTVLQDFAGIGPKSPFNIAEAWIAFLPNRAFAFRVGRMEEAYMDGTRFLIDENLRLNGFEQIVRVPLNGSRGLFGRAFNEIEVRAGEYILSNPNVLSIPPNSPFIDAGYRQGDHLGAANLFHPGMILRGTLSENWTHRLTFSAQIYRNANQIQLASVAAGAQGPGDAVGVSLSTPLTGAGNATTIPGGAAYSAARFRIAHMVYRIESNSIFRIGGKSVPGFVDLQVARNVGARRLRDAVMGSASFGAVRKFGDVRAMYQFTIKDANSMVSQLTDDDLGTGTGVNLAVHAMRVDVGLSNFLQWQNMFYIQHEKSPSNPEQQFFVPVQRGANATFRYFGQLLFVF